MKNSKTPFLTELPVVKTDFRLVIESIILLKNLKISYFYKCVTVAAELFHLLCTVYLHFPGIPGGGLCEPHQHSVPHSSPHSVWVRTHFRLSNYLLEYSFILHTNQEMKPSLCLSKIYGYIRFDSVFKYIVNLDEIKNKLKWRLSNKLSSESLEY